MFGPNIKQNYYGFCSHLHFFTSMFFTSTFLCLNCEHFLMFIFLRKLWICVWNNEYKRVWENILLIIIIIFYVSWMCCLNITSIGSYNYLVPRSNVINWQLSSLLMFFVLEIELFSYWVRLWSEVFLSPIWVILVSSS